MSKITVHELAADWEPWFDRYTFRVAGGRVDWDTAEYVGERLRISRIETGLLVRYRYVDPDTVVTLRPIV